MPHFVTAALGYDHVSSTNQAHYNASTYGPGQYVLSGGKQMAATMTDSNTIRILSGMGLVNGRFWEIEGAFEEYTIENGTPGFKRTDLVVCHIETAPQEKLDIRVLKGEETTGDPVMPAYIEGDLNDGDTVVEQPLHAVTLDGINPEEPVAQFEVTPSLVESWDSQSQYSAEPVAVGRWVDGRTIYRRVFSAPAKAGQTVIDGIPAVRVREFWCVANGKISIAAPYMSETGNSYLYISVNDSQKINVRTTLNLSGMTLYGILEYIV